MTVSITLRIAMTVLVLATCGSENGGGRLDLRRGALGAGPAHQ